MIHDFSQYSYIISRKKYQLYQKKIVVIFWKLNLAILTVKAKYCGMN